MGITFAYSRFTCPKNSGYSFFLLTQAEKRPFSQKPFFLRKSAKKEPLEKELLLGHVNRLNCCVLEKTLKSNFQTKIAVPVLSVGVENLPVT